MFYWSNRRLQHKEKENYGDLLSEYIVEKLSGKQVKWVHPRKLKWYKNKKHFFAIGSILGQATKHSHVWGSGIIEEQQEVAPATFYAVRGPRTYKRLIELGIDCVEIYGDPAILMPDIYNPEIDKKYKYGWIPHYTDHDVLHKININDSDCIIDLNTNDVELTTKKILECKYILSSSLHGLIIAHAYGIPAVWIKLSDHLSGDGIKFVDYMESVQIEPYNSLNLDQYKENYSAEVDVDAIFNTLLQEQLLPSEEVLKNVRLNILNACPFFHE
ncbi:MAG: polysaccharide pyruvyl transferase family protein [Leeuwenhoekiella sp.]